VFEIKHYGVLGYSKEAKTQIPSVGDKDVICDPAGLNFINTNDSTKYIEAGGASEAIYQHIGIQKIGQQKKCKNSENLNIYKTVQTEIKQECQACCKKYTIAPNSEINVIHVVGPNYGNNTNSKWTTDDMKRLIEAYKAVFNVFVTYFDNSYTLRLLPISSDIFAGKFKKEIPKHSFDAIQKVLNDLTSTNKAKISCIDYCMFRKQEHENFTETYKKRPPIQI
jgi:hypothetical protein